MLDAVRSKFSHLFDAPKIASEEEVGGRVEADGIRRREVLSIFATKYMRDFIGDIRGQIEVEIDRLEVSDGLSLGKLKAYRDVLMRLESDRRWAANEGDDDAEG